MNIQDIDYELVPRYKRREFAAQRMLRIAVNGYYKQYCDKLRQRLKDPMADKQTLFSMRDLCAVWHPDRLQEYFDSNKYRMDCQYADMNNYDANDWWECYMHWMETHEDDLI
jgi:hypothetical protein